MGKADASEVINLEDDDDLILYTTPISTRGINTKNPIPFEQYTEEKELHQAILASLTHPTIQLQELDILTPKLSKKLFKLSVTETGESSNSVSLRTHLTIDLSDEEEVEILTSNPSKKKQKQTETQQPSISVFMCEICTEPKLSKESFNIKGCSHSYCSDCMVKYVALKIQENITSIRCPELNCRGVLEPEFCRSILPMEVFDRWCNALCESLILGAERFYCPYKNCSALLMDDEGTVVKESECPHCRRLFCAQCKVPWHSEISCEEFQKLNENERGREDILVMKLAKSRNWKRCPKCNIYVEKIDGCEFILCRCGHEFCYKCGRTTTQNHYCSHGAHAF